MRIWKSCNLANGIDKASNFICKPKLKLQHQHKRDNKNLQDRSELDTCMVMHLQSLAINEWLNFARVNVWIAKEAGLDPHQ